MEAQGAAAQSTARSARRPAGARLHFIGGGRVEVVQGAAIANRRLEAAIEDSKPFTSLTELHGKASYVNPLAVTYIEQGEDQRGSAPARDANAWVCFIGGTWVAVLQGTNVVNKRLEESRAAHGLFAALTDTSGRAVFVSHGAVTYVTSTATTNGGSGPTSPAAEQGSTTSD
jgi:hypothetical protein